MKQLFILLALSLSVIFLNQSYASSDDLNINVLDFTGLFTLFD